MLPTEQQVKDAAPIIAANVHKISTEPTPPHSLYQHTPTLLVDDVHGIYVPFRFCKLYTSFNIEIEGFECVDFDEFFEELLTAINEHTPDPYAVFWYEGALWYSNESEFLNAPDTTPADTNQEPF